MPPYHLAFSGCPNHPKGSLKMAHRRLADILADDTTPPCFIRNLATSRRRSICYLVSHA
nr:hypothetical protein [uncultured Kingella sp.]